MPNSTDHPTTLPPSANAHWFGTTHWSVVLAAGHESSAASAEALEQLCRTYWYPLYAYVRRAGHGPHEAEDLTQAFFARFLEKQHVQLAERERGRFRNFLLTSLKHFLINERNREAATKRGAGAVMLSFDAEVLENRYAREPESELSPDKLYDRRWAGAILDQAFARLGAEFAEADKALLFEQLNPFVWGEKGGASYAEIGQALGLSEGAVKVAVHRLRRRFRELLRAEVAHTVAEPEQIDEELREMLAALGG